MLVFQAENILSLFTPMIFMMLGTMYYLPGKYQKLRFNIMVGIVLLFMIAILAGHGETDNVNVRISRLFKHHLFTIGCFFFIINLLLIDTFDPSQY